MSLNKRKIFSDSFYYIHDENNPHTFRFTLNMRDSIDAKSIEYACEKTVQRYPYLLVQAVVENEQIFIVENTRPVICKNTTEPINLMSPASNYHLLAITYYGNSICLDFSHSLMDGNMALRFTHTLLYFYCTHKYNIEVSTESIGISPDEIVDEEIENPYLKGKYFDTSKCKMSKPVDTDNACSVINDPRVKASKIYAYKITLDQEDVMKVCKVNDSSPATLFTLLMAKSLYETTKSDHVICGIATNLRPALKTPKSHYSTVGNIYFEYDRALRNLSFSKQCSILRGRVILKSRPEELAEGLRNSYKFYKYINSLPTIKERRDILYKLVKGALRKSTCNVSYTGQSHFGELDTYVDTMFVDLETDTGSPTLEILSAGGKFCLTYMQPFQGDVFFNAFLDEFVKLGMPYEIFSEGFVNISGSDFKAV